MDSGSTNNFIQDRVAKQLGLNLKPAQSFQVLVGNGEELQCSTICQNVGLNLGPQQFWVDLFVVPLRGDELVLGVEWLKSLGPVLTDYEKLTLTFLKECQLVQLQGEARQVPEEASLHQLKRMVSTHVVETLLQLQLVSPTLPSEPTPSAITWLDPLLNTYSHLFTEPKGLPPKCPIDHTMPILTSANPVNVRPYRYPHFQKQEIETQIREMLSQSIIQPSSSAFSSPVLLVKKKDDTWRFLCRLLSLKCNYGEGLFPHSSN